MLDFSKAFDTLNHDRLLLKLKNLGFSVSAVSWFQSYLSNRSQSTLVKTCHSMPPKLSSKRQISNGVPQGSILGPSLYNLYAADLLHLMTSSLKCSYADDTSLLYSFFPDNLDAAFNTVNTDLAMISNWSRDNGLILNSNKSVYMIIDPTNRLSSYDLTDLTIDIDNQPLTRVTEYKNLGLWFDEKLTFEKHVNVKSQAAFLRMRSLYPYRKLLSSHAKLQLCNTLILSLFDYCDVVYRPCLNSAQNKRIQAIQNICLRYTYNVRKFSHITPYRTIANWLKMRHRWISHFYTYLHTILHKNSPPYLRERLHYLSEYHQHYDLQTRHSSSILYIPLHNTSKFENSFSYIGPYYYNLLSPELKSLSFFSFRNQLFNFITSNFTL